MTATQAAERIGASPSACSYHLRELAKVGIVEDAGGGTSRRRPWRIAARSVQMLKVSDDPATELAATALAKVVRDRRLERYEAWVESEALYPRVWREAAKESEHLDYLTADELKDLNRQMAEASRDAVREPGVREPLRVSDLRDRDRDRTPLRRDLA